MRKPRLNDFDPHAPLPLGSPMDQLPSIQPPQKGNERGRRHDEKTLDRPSERPLVRTTVRPDNISHQRTTSRYSFEFYRDQVETLKRWAAEATLAGGNGNMSEMVREAVDTYIALKREQVGK
jgi:hypothetical protein